MRSEGYDSGEVDAYAEELRSEIIELRRALETATQSNEADTRLHDPEGAVTRTLAIAQETADRVLHDAQVEADRRRSDADEHATTTIAEADERAARLLSDMEAQAAEVREQGVAAARSAIQVERDKAMAELAHIRRVRDDLRTEAVDLKAALDKYRSQAREASDTLASAASGPLMSLDLPDFIDDDVVLAGIVNEAEAADYQDDADTQATFDLDDRGLGDDGSQNDDLDGLDDVEDQGAGDDSAAADATDEFDLAEPDDDAGAHLRAVEYDDTDHFDIDAEPTFADPGDATGGLDAETDDQLAEVISIDADSDYTADDPDDDGSGAFLAEVRAAAEDDVALPPENEDSDDRFLSELRGLTDEDEGPLDSDAADTFFDD